MKTRKQFIEEIEKEKTHRLILWQAKSGQIVVGVNDGIPLIFADIVEGELGTFSRDIEDFDELKCKEFYHLK